MAQSVEDFQIAIRTLSHRNEEQIRRTAAVLRDAALLTRNPYVCLAMAKEFLDGVLFRTLGLRMPARLYRLVELPVECECNNTRRLDYPTPDLVKYPNRLNDARDPVLYACTDLPLVLLESKVAVGMHFGVLEYELREREELTLPHLGLTHSNHEHEPFSLGLAAHEAMSREFNLSEVAKRNLDLIHECSGELIREASSEIYPATIAIGKVILHEIFPNADGLLYPSIYEGASVNVALRPSSADAKLRRTRAWRAAVLETGKGKLHIHHVACSSSINDDGRITWSAPNDHNLMPGLPIGLPRP